MEVFLQQFLFNKELAYGTYFDYTEYMWSQRDQPGILLVFFEDLKRVQFCQFIVSFFSRAVVIYNQMNFNAVLCFFLNT